MYKIKAIFLFFMLISGVVEAQNLKLGYIYEDYVLQNLPQTKKLKEDINIKKAFFEAELQKKTDEYKAKYEAYQASIKDISNTTTEILNAKVKEVQELQKGVQAFHDSADVELQKMAREKLNDIQEAIIAAEKVVAKEKKYPFVFRRNIDYSNQESRPIMLFSADEGKDNLSDAVIVKLGGTPPTK